MIAPLRAPQNPRHEPRPRENDRWTLGYAQGQGYFVINPRGQKVTCHYRTQWEAEERLEKLRREASVKAKRGPRPCMCCGKVFDSDGVHNRLCGPCKSRGYATWETA